MDYVRLGSTGLKVSRLCLGTMTYGTPDVAAVGAGRGGEPPVHPARARARHQLLRHRRHVLAGRERGGAGARAAAMAARHEVVIATKVFYPMGDEAERAAGCRASTSSTPSTARCGGWAPTTWTCTRSTASTRDTPIEETLEALDDVVKAGKARYLGASSMYAWQFATMRPHARSGTAGRGSSSMQNHYNLVYREEEREMMPLCRAEGIGVIPWSPLARGFLAGNRSARRPRDATPREQHDDYAHGLYYARGRLRGRRAGGAGGAASAACRRRRWRSRGCCTQPGDHGADHRRDPKLEQLDQRRRRCSSAR